MATELDNIFGPLAVTLLDRFGHSATLWSINKGEYQMGSGRRPQTETSSPVKILPPQIDFKREGQRPSTGDSASTLQRSNWGKEPPRPTLMAAQGNPVPKVGDDLEIAGKRYTLTKVKWVYSGENPAYYELRYNR